MKHNKRYYSNRISLSETPRITDTCAGMNKWSAYVWVGKKEEKFSVWEDNAITHDDQSFLNSAIAFYAKNQLMVVA